MTNLTGIIESASASDSADIQVPGLYTWYISAYPDGETPVGDMAFMYDFPEDQWADIRTDFRFVTTQIRLNQQNEMEYMEYVYDPRA